MPSKYNRHYLQSPSALIEPKMRFEVPQIVSNVNTVRSIELENPSAATSSSFIKDNEEEPTNVSTND